jgi:hypothetical protein
MHAIDQLQDFFITYLEKQAITKEKKMSPSPTY